MAYDRTYTDPDGFEWDRDKAATNLSKHGVDFADAVGALEDEFALTLRDPDSAGEERFVSIGADPLGRLLVVLYTLRRRRIRIISARRATRSERRTYEER